MSHLHQQNVDVLVVGAGPAGIAAAVRSAEGGRTVTIVDDNPALGGQIWRGGPRSAHDRQASAWFRKIKANRAITLLSGQVFSADSQRQSITLECSGGAAVVTWRTLILATGARELFLPFPGWTLPGVTGVGGLQALAKSGLPVGGKRVIVAGSGPLLMAVASYLHSRGAILQVVAEQAPWSRLVRFTSGLWRFPSKSVQALRLRLSLSEVPYRPGCWVTRAEGDGQLQRVHLTNGSRLWTEECDYAAVAFGLWPNTELAGLLGLQMNGNAIAADSYGRTSIENVLCAGEASGIGGLDLSLAEGEIAGFTACNNRAAAEATLSRRKRALQFAQLLESTFALRPELKQLAGDDTIVCRCEDVTLKHLRQVSSGRAAKLYTRCGMGPCQGRICGPAVNTMFGWEPSSIRPPIFPARLDSFLA